MHIPDGFLSTPVWAAAGAMSVPGIAICARKANAAFEQGKVPLMGVMGAFVFAAQMINFPVGLGTSGHLLGGALLAMTLGPAAACIVMTAILVVQALLFQDGGLLALGANVLNMGLVGVLVGYLPFRYFRGSVVGIFIGGFLSVFVSACLALSQLALSGVTMPPGVLAVSLGLFVVSAAIEGGITVAVVRSLERLNAGWISRPQDSPSRVLAVFLVIAILLATVGALLASALPDGLEKVAEQAGIADRARSFFSTPFTDYEARFLSGDSMRKALAGLAGMFATLAVCAALGRWIAVRKSA